LLETNSGGTTQAAYTLEPQRFGNLLSQRRSSASHFHHFDVIGSTDSVTNAAEIKEVHYQSKAFGPTEVLSGSLTANRYLWNARVGYRWEPDTQQYDVRRRKYGASRGGFISVDPRRRGTNWYKYGMNSPLWFIDPSGLDCEVISGPRMELRQKREHVVWNPKSKTYNVSVRGNVRITAKLCCTDKASAEKYEWYQWVNGVLWINNIIDKSNTTNPTEDYCPDDPGITYRYTCKHNVGRPKYIDSLSGGPEWLKKEHCKIHGKKSCQVFRIWAFDTPGIGDPNIFFGHFNPAYEKGFDIYADPGYDMPPQEVVAVNSWLTCIRSNPGDAYKYCTRWWGRLSINKGVGHYVASPSID